MEDSLPAIMAPSSNLLSRNRSSSEAHVEHSSTLEFERILEEEKDRAYSFAYYYLGNPSDAEDVVQESLIKLWQHLSGIEGAAGGWLHRVVRNACFDRLRRRRTARRVLQPEAETDQVPATDLQPNECLERSDLRAAVQREVARLPEPYRSSVVLRELQEMKYREIGEILDLPVNTVKTHVHRGRRLLRQRLRQSVASHTPAEGTGEDES